MSRFENSFLVHAPAGQIARSGTKDLPGGSRSGASQHRHSRAKLESIRVRQVEAPTGEAIGPIAPAGQREPEPAVARARKKIYSAVQRQCNTERSLWPCRVMWRNAAMHHTFLRVPLFVILRTRTNNQNIVLHCTYYDSLSLCACFSFKSRCTWAPCSAREQSTAPKVNDGMLRSCPSGQSKAKVETAAFFSIYSFARFRTGALLVKFNVPDRKTR